MLKTTGIIGCVLALVLAVQGDCPAEEKGASGKKKIELKLRAPQETGKGSGRYHALERTESWSPANSAIIVCDMWDLHHCLNATLRGGELAPRMNKVLNLSLIHI